MSTDLAVIEAALKERQPRFDPCGTCRYCGIRKATGWSEPRDAGGSFVATCAECFIPGPNAYLAELVERVKAAEAAIERVRAVRMVGDLTARHLGRTISIPNLHQPGADWDAPKVTVTGKLDKLTSVPFGRGEVRVGLSPKTVQLDRPLPLDWPCEVQP